MISIRLIIIFTNLCTLWVSAIDSPASATEKNPSTKAFSNVSEKVGDAFEAVEDRIEDTIRHYSAFAGNIFPILSKLYISPDKARQIARAIHTVQEPGDWIFIFLLGWATIPVIKYPYEKIVLGRSLKGTGTARPFRESYIYHFAEHISQAGKIAALVYGLDCLAIAIETIGFHQINHFVPSVAKGIYTIWMFSRFNTFKKFLVFKTFGVSSSKEREDPRRKGHFARAKIVNNILEIVCVAAWFFVMVDILNVRSGATLKSLFAVSGAGTVVLSLATKDIAAEVVSGLALQASDKVYEGEKVVFGNGLKGYVDRIGLFETLIRDSSELVTAVSNRELHNQRLSNISRNQFSQVKQKVHFYYEDLDRLPSLIEEIKNEIVRSCPVVVSDGTKPLRVYFHQYGDCALEIIVDVKMYATPDSTQYYQCREQVLLAVGRAVKKKDMKFAVLTEMLE
jgi:small-conductance mechanosensitive channel